MIDIARLIRDTSNELLKRSIKTGAFNDSWVLFNVVTKNGNTTEHRLQIYIFELKEWFQRWELKWIGWISGK